tara:strand:+ start:18889 stop:19068 length:180 start_codon:yes stop_codon:yes gene_type:complete
MGKKKKAKVVIKLQNKEFTIERWIDKLQEEEHYLNLKDKIKEHENDKENQLYFYQQFGY